MGPVLPAGVRALRQMIAAASLTETCTVSTPGTWVPDSSGGGTYTTPTTRTFACRRSPLGSGGGAERIVAEQMEDPALEVLTYPLGEDLTGAETVTISGVKYAVVDRIPTGTYASRQRAVIRREGTP